MLGTIKSKTYMLWMLLSEEKFLLKALLAEALKGDLEIWWLLWLDLSHRLLEKEKTYLAP